MFSNVMSTNILVSVEFIMKCVSIFKGFSFGGNMYQYQRLKSKGHRI